VYHIRDLKKCQKNAKIGAGPAFALRAMARQGRCGGMVDAIDSKSITSNGVEVRVLSPAQI
jgi:hypothetical protein